MQSRKGQFTAQLLKPASKRAFDFSAFLVLPKNISELLPRRGRITTNITLNGESFQVRLEPDGQLSHWLPLTKAILDQAKVKVGDTCEITVSPVDLEPAPKLPDDFRLEMKSCLAAYEVWNSTSSLAQVDWIHWIESAKQAKTRAKRITSACEMLAAGKKRVCCFDTSGFYSKAFSAPEPEAL